MDWVRLLRRRETIDGSRAQVRDRSFFRSLRDYRVVAFRRRLMIRERWKYSVAVSSTSWRKRRGSSRRFPSRARARAPSATRSGSPSTPPSRCAAGVTGTISASRTNTPPTAESSALTAEIHPVSRRDSQGGGETKTTTSETTVAAETTRAETSRPAQVRPPAECRPRDFSWMSNSVVVVPVRRRTRRRTNRDDAPPTRKPDALASDLFERQIASSDDDESDDEHARPFRFDDEHSDTDAEAGDVEMGAASGAGATTGGGGQNGAGISRRSSIEVDIPLTRRGSVSSEIGDAGAGAAALTPQRSVGLEAIARLVAEQGGEGRPTSTRSGREAPGEKYESEKRRAKTSVVVGRLLVRDASSITSRSPRPRRLRRLVVFVVLVVLVVLVAPLAPLAPLALKTLSRRVLARSATYSIARRRLLCHFRRRDVTTRKREARGVGCRGRVVSGFQFPRVRGVVGHGVFHHGATRAM